MPHAKHRIHSAASWPKPATEWGGSDWLFEHNQDAVLRCTWPGGVVVAANAQAARLWGSSREALKQRRIDRLVGASAAGLQELIESAAHRGHAQAALRYERFDGERRDATWLAGVQARSAPSGPVLVSLIVRPVAVPDAQTQAGDALFQALADAAPVGIFRTDVSGACVYTNQRWRDIRGLHSREALGSGWLQGIVPEDKAALLAAWRQSQVQQSDGTAEYRALLPDGHERLLRSRWRPCLAPDQQLLGYVGCLEDITDQRRAEQALHAREVAERANTLKTEFMSNMSHELRTPLNAMIGMTELALDTELAPDVRSYLTLGLASARGLLTMVNDILDCAKLGAAELHLQTAPFSPQELFTDVLRTCAPEADAKSLALIGHWPQDLPQHCMGDAGRLRQVLLNLLGNGIKFTQAGEVSLTVVAERLAPERLALSFSVCDTGIGIPPAQQSRLFKAFEQLDSSNTRRYGGAGMGLAVCRQLIELMGGGLSLHNGQGQGSCFRFRIELPCSAADDAAEPAAWLAGRHVLVVDESAAVRDQLQTQLHALAAQVVVAADVADAKAQLQACADGFDLCLLSVKAAQHAASTDFFSALASTPVLPLLTVAHAHRDAAWCAARGWHAHVVKPVLPGDLAEALQQLASVLQPPAGLNASDPGAAEPAASAPNAASPVNPREGLQAGEASLNILVAEDHPINQAMITAQLEKWGHRVSMAENGREALDRWRDSAFDLILMDIQMPEMDGLAATMAIRQQEAAMPQPSHIPIYALSAAIRTEDQMRAVIAGLDGYLCKPLDRAALQDVLHDVARAALPGAVARPGGHAA